MTPEMLTASALSVLVPVVLFFGDALWCAAIRPVREFLARFR